MEGVIAEEGEMLGDGGAGFSREPTSARWRHPPDTRSRSGSLALGLMGSFRAETDLIDARGLGSKT